MIIFLIILGWWYSIIRQKIEIVEQLFSIRLLSTTISREFMMNDLDIKMVANPYFMLVIFFTIKTDCIHCLRTDRYMISV